MNTRALNVISQLKTTRPYKNQSSLDLLNSLAVFQMCGIPALVNSFPSVVKLAKFTKTSSILNAIIKRGENLKEVVPTIQRLGKTNVGSILDLAIEADMDAVDLDGENARVRTEQMVISLMECIDIASYQPESFIAVKVTALAPPSLLLSWSATLVKLEEALTKITHSNTLVNLDQFKKLQATFPGLAALNLELLFRLNDLNNSGTLSLADVTSIFSLYNVENCRALVCDQNVSHVLGRSLSHLDLDTAALILPEIKKLVEYAQYKKVKLMMDAEQTYFQPAIDDIVIGLCRLFNKERPIVFTTYQMYLKRSLAKLQDDVVRASQKGYYFGIKLVRGAYMMSERERASKLGFLSPIHDSITDSHVAYNSALTFIIQKQAMGKLELVVASHNHESIEHTTIEMQRHNVPKIGFVAFAQLLGMQDGVTSCLGSQGYKALKYVPYGPVDVVTPYLHRRAQENATMIQAMRNDKIAILKELGTRIWG